MDYDRIPPAYVAYVDKMACKGISHMGMEDFNMAFWNYVTRAKVSQSNNNQPYKLLDITDDMRDIINKIKKTGKIDASIDGIDMNFYITEVEIGDITYQLWYWERLNETPFKIEIVGFTTTMIPETKEKISDKLKFYSKESLVDGKLNNGDFAKVYNNGNEENLTDKDYSQLLKTINTLNIYFNQ